MRNKFALSRFLQFVLFVVSVFFAVPFSLMLHVPAILILCAIWLMRMLSPGFLVLAFVLMGWQLSYLSQHPFGFGVVFFGMLFVLWSWLLSHQWYKGMGRVFELSTSILGVFVLAFFMQGSLAFWLMQAGVILIFESAYYWRRGKHV